MNFIISDDSSCQSLSIFLFYFLLYIVWNPSISVECAGNYVLYC